MCLRPLGADIAASIIPPHAVRLGNGTLATNNRAPGTAKHQRARTALRTIQRPY